MQYLYTLSLLWLILALPEKAISVPFSPYITQASTSGFLHTRHQSEKKDTEHTLKAYNLTTCSVWVKGNDIFRKNKLYDQAGHFYIIQGGIHSPKTTTGQNIDDAYFTTEAPTLINFATDKRMMHLNSHNEDANIDYATVKTGSHGYTFATVDYADVYHPDKNSPLKFTTEMKQQSGSGYLPPTRYTMGPQSELFWNFRYKGPHPDMVIGGIDLSNTGVPLSGGFGTYAASFKGDCHISTFNITVR